MDTLLIGSDGVIDTSKEHELISIWNESLAFTIKGKASHPNSNYEYDQETSSVRMNIAEGGFSVHIYGKDSELDNVGAGVLKINSKPLFFEQRNYSITVEFTKSKPEDTVEFWHESKLIREKITETGKLHRDKETKLSGTINFGNEIGSSIFDIRVNGRIALRIEIEVFPTKLDYKNDYEAMLQQVTDEVHELAFDFLKKTFQNVGLGKNKDVTLTTFWSLLNYVFDKMMIATGVITERAHHELVKSTEIMPTYKLHGAQAKTINWMNSHPGAAVRTGDGKIRFERALGVKKQITFDTFENQFVKYILESTLRRLIQLEKVYTKDGYSRDTDAELIKKIQCMQSQIRKKIQYTFLSEVSNLKQTQSMSLVFAMAPGYRELYKCYLILKRGLSLHGDLFRISMKDTAVLYEYWCFIMLNRILRESKDSAGNKKYQLKKLDILKVDNSGLTVVLKKGSSSEVRYLNLRTNEIFSLKYNPTMPKLPTVSQKPDNVLSLERKDRNSDRKFEYVFDAKYRINMALPGTEYARDYGTPGPELDTINAMHRYRDAIVFNSGDSETVNYERRMFGAYVLFPYADEAKFKEHKLYKSIETMNIGGLPFLPSHTELVEKMLDQLISDSNESAFERATLPIGIEEKLKNVDLSERNVLVGMINSYEQLEACIETGKYSIPVSKIADSSFPFEYIALHQTKQSNTGFVGIQKYGRIWKYAKELLETQISNGETERQECYVFDVEDWQELAAPIGVKEDDHISDRYYTNIELLQTCDTRQELSMESLEQLRLLRELERITKVNVDSTEDNMLKGFEYNGGYITVEGNEIHILRPDMQQKNYMLSYAKHGMKKLFSEIKEDMGCE